MTATQEEIAAAWSAWQSRHGGKLGPGPAFVEAINAALAVRLPTLESLQRENEELRNLADRLKQEAQQHAMEARGANSTIAEIYQIISYGKGEPGNWNGAEPVRKYAEAAEAEVKRLRDLLQFSHDTLWEINPSNYDHDDVCKLNDASVEVILAIAPELGETHGKSKEWWDERQALASTGGEHHADK